MDKEIEELIPDDLKVAFKKIEALDLSNFTNDDREKYDESIKVYRDNLVTYAGAMEKGRIEGKIEERREIALKFKNMGMPINVIAEGTGLSEEEIRRL